MTAPVTRERGRRAHHEYYSPLSPDWHSSAGSSRPEPGMHCNPGRLRYGGSLSQAQPMPAALLQRGAWPAAPTQARCTPRARPRAYARALYCPQRKIAMLAWELKCSLSCGRLDLQDNMGPLRTRLLPQRTTRRRASARCTVHNRKVAMLAWELKCSLSGDRWGFQVNMGPLRTRLLP